MDTIITQENNILYIETSVLNIDNNINNLYIFLEHNLSNFFHEEYNNYVHNKCISAQM